MRQALDILARARDWVTGDARVRAALVHGSLARGTATALSDVDLVVVAEPGQREAIWAERREITRRLLNADPVVSWEVPHQRPFRWQARTSELDMLDLTVDENTVAVWVGLTGAVEFLADRADVRTEFETARAGLIPPEYDAVGECDGTWGLFAWLAGALLQRRTLIVRAGIGDLVFRRLLPLLERSPYEVGSVDDHVDQATVARLDKVYPRNCQPAELARALHEAAGWYADLLTSWSGRTGRPRPRSGLESRTIDVLRQLAEGGDLRLHPPA
jgi:hypothetical protein